MLGIPRNILFLTFLYFIQGLPYGLQVQFLPVYMRNLGADLKNVSLLKLLHIPWLCKPLWAPLVDRFGTKKQWLLASISGLLVACLVISFVPPQNITMLCWLLLGMNLAAATQDIAVDSVAMSLLTAGELGQGNAAQVVGYKIGSVFGGGVIVGFIKDLGWQGLFIALALLYLEALLFVFVSPVMRDEDRVAREKRTSCLESGVVNTDSDGDSVFDDNGSEEEEKMKRDFEASESDLSEIDDNEKLKTNDLSDSQELKFSESDSSSSNRRARNSSMGRSSEKLSDIEETLERSEECARKGHSSADDLHKEGVYSGEDNSGPLHRKSAAKQRDEVNRGVDDDDLELGSEAQLLKVKVESTGNTGFEFVRRILEVPGTQWLMGFVLLYKLGEQGALSMLPLLLIDMNVSLADVTFWNGVIGQAVSIAGSVLGGLLITRGRFPATMLLQQLTLLRLLPVGIQTLIIAYWHQGDRLSFLHQYICVATMLLLLLLGGMVTTITFTCMMQCSRSAPREVRATHFSLLTTLEVFGKLTFVSLMGYVTDVFGFPLTFLTLIVLTAAVVPLFNLDSFPGESCFRPPQSHSPEGDTDGASAAKKDSANREDGRSAEGSASSGSCGDHSDDSLDGIDTDDSDDDVSDEAPRDSGISNGANCKATNDENDRDNLQVEVQRSKAEINNRQSLPEALRLRTKTK